MRATSFVALATLLFTSLSIHAAENDGPRCQYVKVADLPIRYVGRNLAPAVDGSINGTPARLVIDTGSTMTSLTMTGVARRGMSLMPTGRHFEGIGGISRMYASRVREIGIGSVHVNKHFELPVIGDSAAPFEYDALLGAPFLLRTDLMLDLRAKKMAMYKPQDCDKTDLLLWDEPTIAVPTWGNSDKDPNPHFTVFINGKKMEAFIDSGAHRSVMTLDAAERIGFNPKDPKALRLGDAVGIGSERVPHWIAPIQTFQIEGETIKDAEIGVIDTRGSLSADLLLGQDFLRAHRVLFAMRQDKLYLAYLGGDVFTRGTQLEPWMRAEAEGGSADAQYALATMFGSGRGVARDPAQAKEWMQRAVASGQPNAVLEQARHQVQAGQAADAIPKLRTALDQLPAERFGPLWLYLARVRTGEPELARAELQAALKKLDDDDWPTPIALFYLGKWDFDKLLKEAADDKKAAHYRTCQAQTYAAELYGAQGDGAKQAASRDYLRANCGPPAAKPKSAPAVAVAP